MHDGEHAAFAIRQTATALRTDRFQVIEIGTYILWGAILRALHEAALHLGECVACEHADRRKLARWT
jgi:hypothetical protein